MHLMVMYSIIILVSMALVVLLNWLVLGWPFLGALFWTSATTGLEVVIIVLLAILSGWCTPKFFYRECKIYAVSKRELNFYHAIRLGRWKDYVCELGVLGGFSKKKVAAPNDPAYIDRFIFEINKGMFMHLIGILGSFLILLFPVPGLWSVRLPVALVSVLLNVLPIMVLRYNKPRLLMLKTRLMRHQNQPATAEVPDGQNQE